MSKINELLSLLKDKERSWFNITLSSDFVEIDMLTIVNDYDGDKRVDFTATGETLDEAIDTMIKNWEEEE